MPYCTRCGVDNPASARYCDQCGATLIAVPAAPQPTLAPAPARPQPAPAPPRVVSAGSLNAGPINCAQCGASAIPGEAFCDTCGAPLGAPAPIAAPVPAPPASGLPTQQSFPAPIAAIPMPMPAAPSYAPVPSVPAYMPPAPLPTPAYTPVAARTTLAPAQLTLDSGAVLNLPATAQALLGRADPVSNFAPEIDLNSHGAIEFGVGRRHARLLIQQGQVLVEDLNSTNGTTLNGQRLTPGQPQPVRNGDLVVLGSLRMRFSEQT
ncbi:MAG: FHA domain-containing protein [Roseiflexaceae bacterium]|nr:FHA domain-containing protein [Roseiflexaceae bacterium]